MSKRQQRSARAKHGRLFTLAGAAAQLGVSRQVLAKLRASGDATLMACTREVYAADGNPCYFVIEESDVARIRAERMARR